MKKNAAQLLTAGFRLLSESGGGEARTGCRRLVITWVHSHRRASGGWSRRAGRTRAMKPADAA